MLNNEASPLAHRPVTQYNKATLGAKRPQSGLPGATCKWASTSIAMSGGLLACSSLSMPKTALHGGKATQSLALTSGHGFNNALAEAHAICVRLACCGVTCKRLLSPLMMLTNTLSRCACGDCSSGTLFTCTQQTDTLFFRPCV